MRTYMLSEPMSIHGLELKNRLVMPPMAAAGADPQGQVTRRLIRHYETYSAGGYLAMIIAEHSYVRAEGKASRLQLSCADDTAIDGLRHIAEVIHQNGSLACAQISHAGAATKPSITGCVTVAPSVTSEGVQVADRALSKAEIAQLVQDFAHAALRVKQAGFDAVEIHSAHAYLLNQFYSPLTNSRTDEYGGFLENRLRIHLEIIQAIREQVPGFPIFLRFGAIDDMAGGADIRDAVRGAQLLEQAGVDLLDISGGLCGPILKGREHIQGYFSDVTAAIKEQVSIPVLLTGGITDPYAADRLLEAGKADLIGIGRAVLKDPQWAQKAMTRSQV